MLHGVVLQWESLEPAAAFRYTLFRSNGGQFSPVADSAVAWFEDRTATVGPPYQYFVKASNLLAKVGPASAVVESVAGGGADVSPSVSPSIGLAGQTQFLFRADVHDARDATPVAWVVIGGLTYTMERTGQDCRVECVFTRALTLPALNLEHPRSEYRMDILDGGALSHVPEEGGYPGPKVVALAHVDARHGINIPAIGLALAPALLAFALLRRRKSA
jgi:hypothetical protein